MQPQDQQKWEIPSESNVVRTAARRWVRQQCAKEPFSLLLSNEKSQDGKNGTIIATYQCYEKTPVVMIEITIVDGLARSARTVKPESMQ
jgi:hypothetical protein